METWAQICVGVAAAALLIGSGAGFAAVRLGSERAWRGGALVGVSALLLGVVLRGPSVRWLPLSGAANRATLVALVAGLLSVRDGWRDATPQGRRPMGWAALIPVAVVTGVGIPDQPTTAGAAPFLSFCVLVVAGLMLWSAGRTLDVWVGDREDNVSSAAIAFAGLTIGVVMVGGANWRVWGTPSGTVTASLALWAVWLIVAARMILRGKSVWLTGTLDLLATALMVMVALNIQWVWPFG